MRQKYFDLSKSKSNKQVMTNAKDFTGSLNENTSFSSVDNLNSTRIDKGTIKEKVPDVTN